MLYCVYITTTRNNTALYTGVTGDLKKRIAEHKLKLKEGFTKKYRADKLVYYEGFEDIKAAITREKQIKGGSRQKKIDLIRGINPKWKDLTSELQMRKPPMNLGCFALKFKARNDSLLNVP